MDTTQLFQQIEGKSGAICMETPDDNGTTKLAFTNLRISLNGELMWENNIISIDFERAEIKDLGDDQYDIVLSNGIVYTVILNNGI